jgi:hypothetical protein
MAYIPEDTNRVKITNKITNATVSVTFDSAKAALGYSGSGLSGAFISKVKGNESILDFDLQRISQGFPGIPADHEFTVEEIAERIIANVVGINS